MIEYNQTITLPEKVIIINSIDDFPEAEIIGTENVITLEENVVYEFGAGTIDLGDNHFIITNGVKFRGQGLTKTTLTTQLTGGIVFNCGGNNSGGVEFEHFQFLCNETGVRLFDISFVTRLYFTGTVWFHAGALGWIENVETMRTDSTTAFIAFNEGLTLRGDNGAVIFDRTGFINIGSPSAKWIIKLAEDATFGNVFQVAGNIFLGFDKTFAIVKENNVTFNMFGFGNEECVYIGFSQFRGGLTPLDGFDMDSPTIKSRFNFGLRDSHVSAGLYFNNFSATTFKAVDTPVKAQGQTSARYARGFNHAQNQLSYLLTNPIRCSVRAQAFITGTAGDEVTVYIAKGGQVDEESACKLKLGKGGTMFTTEGEYDVIVGDYFEIWVENNTGTDDVTVRDKSSFLSIKAL